MGWTAGAADGDGREPRRIGVVAVAAEAAPRHLDGGKVGVGTVLQEERHGRDVGGVGGAPDIVATGTPALSLSEEPLAHLPNHLRPATACRRT